MKGIRLTITLALLLFISQASYASPRKDRQRDTTKYSDTFLDTVKVNNVFVVNDYMLIGFEAGVGFNRMQFNPPYLQTWKYKPEYYELTVTRYGRLFGYMRYFGLKFGVAYGHEGYRMKANDEGMIAVIEGATDVTYDVVEVPIMSHFHYDFPHFKIMADVGPYAGYRLNIQREGPYVAEDMVNTFLDTDIRFDYGLKGGVGFALVFDPVELHVNAKVRYGWSRIFEPDYASKYYYRYAYPFDLMVTAGLHFQLSKKTGKTKSMLRKEAHDIVFPPKVEEPVEE